MEESDKNALEVRNMCMKQGKFRLKDISFTLPRGYIMGLVGRMGSGKTTLLKSILNPALIKSGSVEYEGSVGFIMEDAPFFIEATLKENMELFKKLYKDYDEKEFYDRLQRMGIGEHKVYGLLSKGEKVRFQFAFAMGIHPGLLLLDEPTSGLDAAFKREFLYMLQEAVEKEMVSIIISTHLTDELERIADIIGVMDNGILTLNENNIQGTENQENNPDKGHTGRTMPDFKGMYGFCYGVYLKSNMRFASYVICFMQFVLGWIMFLADEDIKSVLVFVSGLVAAGMMFQCIAASTKEGEGRRIVPLKAEKFFGLNRWTMWKARMLCFMRSSLCFAVVLLIQLAAAAAITGDGETMLIALGIVADYMIVAVMTAIMTFIFC